MRTTPGLIVLLGLLVAACCQPDPLLVNEGIPLNLEQAAPTTSSYFCTLGSSNINEAAVSVIPESTASKALRVYLSTQPITSPEDIPAEAVVCGVKGPTSCLIGLDASREVYISVYSDNQVSYTLFVAAVGLDPLPSTASFDLSQAAVYELKGTEFVNST